MIDFKNIFRGDANSQPHAWHDFPATYCKTSVEGRVYQDVDLIARSFNPNIYGHSGTFRMIECKSDGNDATVGGMKLSQKKTLGMMHRLWRKGDPDQLEYKGFYIVWTDSYYWRDAKKFKVNGAEITKDEFIQWLDDELYIAPYESLEAYQ